MLNGLCWDDDYTIAQWLEHRWLQARVPGSSPGGDSRFFLQTFPVCLFPSNQLILLLLLLLLSSGSLIAWSEYEQKQGVNSGDLHLRSFKMRASHSGY